MGSRQCGSEELWTALCAGVMQPIHGIKTTFVNHNLGAFRNCMCVGVPKREIQYAVHHGTIKLLAATDSIEATTYIVSSVDIGVYYLVFTTRTWCKNFMSVSAPSSKHFSYLAGEGRRLRGCPLGGVLSGRPPVNQLLRS